MFVFVCYWLLKQCVRPASEPHRTRAVHSWFIAVHRLHISEWITGHNRMGEHILAMSQLPPFRMVAVWASPIFSMSLTLLLAVQ